MLQQRFLTFALLGAEWVLWLLVALSVLCVAVAVERALSAVLRRTPEAPLHAALSEFVRTGDAVALAGSLGKLRGAEARVLAAGAGRASDGVGSVEEALAAATSLERTRMELIPVPPRPRIARVPSGRTATTISTA